MDVPKLFFCEKKKNFVNCGKVIFRDVFGTKYSRVDQAKFAEDSLKCFKDCFPQILLGPFLELCERYIMELFCGSNYSP